MPKITICISHLHTTRDACCFAAGCLLVGCASVCTDKGVLCCVCLLVVSFCFGFFYHCPVPPPPLDACPSLMARTVGRRLVLVRLGSFGYGFCGFYHSYIDKTCTVVFGEWRFSNIFFLDHKTRWATPGCAHYT